MQACPLIVTGIGLAIRERGQSVQGSLKGICADWFSHHGDKELEYNVYQFRYSVLMILKQANAQNIYHAVAMCGITYDIQYHTSIIGSINDNSIKYVIKIGTTLEIPQPKQ